MAGQLTAGWRESGKGGRHGGGLWSVGSGSLLDGGTYGEGGHVEKFAWQIEDTVFDVVYFK